MQEPLQNLCHSDDCSLMIAFLSVPQAPDVTVSLYSAEPELTMTTAIVTHTYIHTHIQM